MANRMFPQVDADIARKRRELAPRQMEAFRAFSAACFAEGALPARMKQLIAVAVAHTTQCPYCIRGHTEAALKAGASEAEIMEGARRSTMDELAAATIAADKVLVF